MSGTQDIQALEWRLIDAHGEPLTEWRRTAAPFNVVAALVHIETRSARSTAPAPATLPTMQEIMLREAMACEGIPVDARERVIATVLSGRLPDGLRPEPLPAPRKTGRDLKPGDCATTDFNGRGRCDRVEIVARRERAALSKSGIQYQVKPWLRNSVPKSWIDADWFTPVIPSNKG